MPAALRGISLTAESAPESNGTADDTQTRRVLSFLPTVRTGTEQADETANTPATAARAAMSFAMLARFELPPPLLDLTPAEPGHVGLLRSETSAAARRNHDVAVTDDDASSLLAPGDAPPSRGREALDLMAGDVAKVAGVTVTAGFLWWLTRGGGLLTMMLMGIPAWRHMDMLPVLARQWDEAGAAADDGDAGGHDDGDGDHVGLDGDSGLASIADPHDAQEERLPDVDVGELFTSDAARRGGAAAPNRRPR